MSAQPKIPPFRNLDIYRLVVARRFRQLDAARSFNVTPARISQVIRRVRLWVGESIGEWLFPRRDDLRFYVALATEQIRVHELDDNPENVVIVGPGWSYSREDRVATELTNLPPDLTAKLEAALAADADAQLGNQPGPHISAHPINSHAKVGSDTPAANTDDQTDCASPATVELANRLAQLLILWKKSRKLSAPRKSPSFGEPST